MKRRILDASLALAILVAVIMFLAIKLAIFMPIRVGVGCSRALSLCLYRVLLQTLAYSRIP